MPKLPIKVIQDPEAEIPTEIIAQAIVDISKSMKKISSGKLNRRAIVALVKDHTGISMAITCKVLDCLESLEKTYCK